MAKGFHARDRLLPLYCHPSQQKSKQPRRNTTPSSPLRQNLRVLHHTVVHPLELHRRPRKISDLYQVTHRHAHGHHLSPRSKSPGSHGDHLPRCPQEQGGGDTGVEVTLEFTTFNSFLAVRSRPPDAALYLESIAPCTSTKSRAESRKGHVS